MSNSPRKDERSEANWTKMEKPNGTIWKKVWLRKIGEDGASTFAGRMTQGIFVGHHDRSGAVVRQKLDETDIE